MRRGDRARSDLLQRSSPGGRQRVPGPDPGRHTLSRDGPPTARQDSVPRLLVIVGPTGTGKSGAATRVARRIGGEIVGCDAVQIYRGLDAATAKPTTEERSEIPHHMVDVADPRRDFTLAHYVDAADRCIREIAARGCAAMVVGGTGLYLRGLLRGIVPAPPRDPRMRERLRAIASRFGPDRLHRWLRRLDPASAQRLPAGDTQRIVRALEFVLSGEGKWSERLDRDGTWAHGVDRYATLKIGLDMDRELLRPRLRDRVDAFFEAGLVAEVRSLLADGVPRDANALKAIGYREVLAALEADRDPDSAREETCRATWRYAKRQRTWFRKEPGVIWLDASVGPDALSDEIVGLWNR